MANDKFRGIAERMWSVAENLQIRGFTCIFLT